MSDNQTEAARPRVCAAVVSYNTCSLLERCLESLVGNERVTVWVVDNGSQDGSAEMVRRRFAAVHLEARSDNLGFGRAVNLVAEREPQWDWLAVANADVALQPGALDALLAAGDADPDAGILAPRLLRADGSTQHSLHQFWSVRFALAYNLGVQRRRPGWGDEQCLETYWDAERSRRAPWAVGAFLLVRREAWDAVGGFDPQQWLYAEDLDLGWRAAHAGWATRYVPEARVRHDESAAAGPLWGSARTERWMAASYDWMLRRQGGPRTRTIAAINVGVSGLRWLFARGDARAEQRRWAALHYYGLRPRSSIRTRMAQPPKPKAAAGGGS